MRGEVNPMFLIAGLLLPFVFFLTFPIQEVITPPFWLNRSFEFRTPIEINATIEANAVDIIIPLTFNSSSLIADGKMQSDCDDIRITLRQIELNYSLESQTCNSNETVVWIETDILDAGNNTHIIYYGNSTAVSESSTAVFDKTTTAYLGYRVSAGGNTPNELLGGGDAVNTNTVSGEIEGYNGNTTNFTERNDFANTGNQPAQLGENFTIYSWWRINKDKNGFNVHNLFDTSGVTMKYENITGDQSLFRLSCLIRNATDQFKDFNTSLDLTENVWFFGSCGMNQTNATAFISDSINFAEQNEDLVGGFRFTASVTRIGSSFGSATASNMNGTYDSFFMYNTSKPVSFLNILATLNTIEGLEEDQSVLG